MLMQDLALHGLGGASKYGDSKLYMTENDWLFVKCR